MAEFIKKEGLVIYESSKNRNIESVEYSKWDHSFVVSSPISLHIEASLAFSSKPKISGMFM